MVGPDVKLKRKKKRYTHSMFNRNAASFATSNPDDFPALKILFHSEDATNGGSQWRDRVGGIEVNFTEPLIKGKHGLSGTQSNSISGIVGSFPTLSSHVIVIAKGKSDPASTELLSSIGEAGANNPVLSSNGISFNAAGALRSLSPALSSAATPSGAVTTTMAQYDLVDTTSPLIMAVQTSLGNNDIPFGTGTTTDTNAINLGGAFDSFFFTPITNETEATWFLDFFAVFDFSTSVAAQEFQDAALEITHSGQLYQGWKHRT